MSNSTIRRVITLGALAIIGIIAVQSYWVLQTWDLEQTKFEQSAHIALRKVAYSIAEMNRSIPPSHNLVKKMSSNYFIVNVNDTIDAGALEYFLQKELETVGLHIDFEYAIYDCSSDEMVYGDYCSYSLEKEPKAKRSDLPKYDDFIYYFGVKFPTRYSHLAGKMQLSIIFSILMLVTILFFIYSISVILRQKRLSEMQKDFINNMTHEFKTPISSIKISADVFLNNQQVKGDSRLYRYAQIIQEQNQRLDGQVEKVLQLAKIERDGLKLNLEKLNLHQTLLGVLEAVKLNIKELGGRLDFSLNALNPEIKADKVHLINILNSLLDNSIKYRQGAPEITISTHTIGRQIELTISDNGIGIAKEHQKQVFKKFYRVPTGNVHNVKGFGLGLYYIQRICAAHGWQLLLESEPGTGTTVRIIMGQAKAKNLFSYLWQTWKLNPIPKP